MTIQPQATISAALRRLTATVKRLEMKKTIGISAFALLLAASSLGLASTVSPSRLQASDHDDGDIDVRSRALSLTDLYVFREQDQNPSANAGDLVFVMNTNPRSLARFQYFFSSAARYEIKIARVNNINGTPTGVPDTTLRFTFTPPDRNSQQRMTITAIDDRGRSTVLSRNTAVTTPLSRAATPVLNTVRARGSNLTVFAGLREDPFFFDVEQFFRVRAGALGTGPAVGFRPPETAIDFTNGYNVNTIAVRVPQRFLQGSGSANITAYDAWLSIAIPDPRTGQFTQTEHLARPAVNEGLVTNQRTLAAYNRSQPSRSVPANVAGDAKQTLLALGNTDARANALLGAFIPDVMRIDTTGASGYANALNAKGAPVRGRLLTDDVIDITLTVLTNGAVTSDNVSYAGSPNNPYQGHSPLLPAFPYLASPN